MIGWLRRLLREPVAIDPVTVLHVHKIAPETERLLSLLVNRVNDSREKPTTVIHEVGTATMGDLNAAVEQGIRTYLAETAALAAQVPRAQAFATPPEPEERIARDIKNAKAIKRGADQLMALARMNGQALTAEAALAQAADMLHSTLDD